MLKLLVIWINKKNKERLVLYTKAQMSKYLVCGSAVILMYRAKKHSWIITTDTIDNFIHKTMPVFEKLLNNELQLDISIQKPLGFYLCLLLNNSNKNDLGYITNLKTQYNYWIGYNYQLASPVIIKNPSSWVYNDTSGNIILELSPIYPWHLTGRIGEKQSDSYENWMKKFHPYIITTIPKKSILDTYATFDQLNHLIDQNTIKWVCQGERHASTLAKEKEEDRRKKRMAHNIFGYF